MPSAFWIVLILAVVALGGIALGAYLIAARKLYLKDEELVSPHPKPVSDEPSQDKREHGAS
jgi:hypothetical protein